MSSRRLVCEAAFGYGPFDTVPAGDWVELTEASRPRLRAADWTFGRDSEFDHYSAGTATVLLSNRDRELDPDNAASPLNGFLLPNVPVRLRSVGPTLPIGDLNVLDGGDTAPPPTDIVDAGDTAFVVSDIFDPTSSGDVHVDEFYGFVRGGWEQQIDTNQSDCRLELQDLLGVMGGYKLPDVFTWQLLQVPSLVGLWELNEARVDESIADLSGNSHDGSVVGDVKFGEQGIAPGHTASALFEAKATAFPDRPASYIDLGRSPLFASAASSTIVATFKYRTLPTLDRRSLFIHGNGNAGSYAKGVVVYIETTSDQLIFKADPGTALKTSAAVPPGGHVVIAGDDGAGGGGVGIDSATLDNVGAGILNLPTFNGVAIGASGNPENYWDGWIGTVAVYDALVGLSDRQAIIAAYGKLDGETSDAHIAWALDRLGVPAERRNLDVGTVIMGTADTAGVDALEWMRDVTSTEGGGLYVDHRDGGKVRFTNRYHRHLSARSVTAQATFSDQPGAAVVRYPAEGLDIAPNGLDGIVNQVTVTWRDGEVVVEDAASVASYGARPRQLDTQATTAGQARSAGEWVVANYGQPRSRVRGATSSARSMQARDDKVEALRVDDRVTFRVQPMKTGTVTEVGLFVDGVTHSARGVQWDTSFRFAPGHTFTPWIWGTSAWNTTAFWG